VSESAEVKNMYKMMKRRKKEKRNREKLDEIQPSSQEKEKK
jgi:hypothetical protein